MESLFQQCLFVKPSFSTRVTVVMPLRPVKTINISLVFVFIFSQNSFKSLNFVLFHYKPSITWYDFFFILGES